MNNESIRIKNQIKEAEMEAKSSGLYRLGFHLMPPTGWLNDPNGLCQLGDIYHIFFQYSPLHVQGGMKAWGHYITKDFVSYQYCGAPFVPDEVFDRDGVFSGSTLVDEDGMHIFYTGNVELPGDYDYTTSGRLADTILIESRDGVHFDEKQVVIDTDEYPKEYSCHIRDPKVWKDGDTYYMVLGGRTREDAGRILVYSSKNIKSWSFCKELMTKDAFAYMWECPDLFLLEENYILSFSPQGLKREEYRYQNIYHAGYFVSKDNPIEKDFLYDGATFREWDMGFDFYAPQTFVDNKGRRILLGWAGVPYAEYSNGEVEEDWQHCLTVPRQLSLGKSSMDDTLVVYQYPVEELEALRKGITLDVKHGILDTTEEYLDIVFKELPQKFSIILAEEMEFTYNGTEICLCLSEDLGKGRTIRKCLINRVNSLRMLIDSSIVEYYINEGEIVFTTRYYKKCQGTVLKLDCDMADVTIYPMNAITIQEQK